MQLGGLEKLCRQTYFTNSFKFLLSPILWLGPVQTSNLPKVITPGKSNTNTGQFVLQSPKGSNGSEGLAVQLSQLGGNLTELSQQAYIRVRSNLKIAEEAR